MAAIAQRLRSMKRSVLVLVLFANVATATAAPFTGAFRGEGRACFGGLFVKTKTIEWNASFFKCGPVRYAVVEQALENEHPRIVFQINDPQKTCGIAVLSLEHHNAFFWTADGYPSVEAFEKRDLPA